MTNILLTRHGHVDNPARIFYGPDIHLSERGKRQILALARDMKSAGKIPTRIIYSPYVRTTESAMLFADTLDIVNISSDDRLVEWQVGDWYGKPLADFYAYTKYDQFPAYPLPPELEPLESCAMRVQQVLTEIVRDAPNETVLVVSHREPLASAILTYQQKKLDTIRELELPTASSWESSFETTEKPSHLALRFDRSSLD
jgi:broad specificity phosphatase PhoE